MKKPILTFALAFAAGSFLLTSCGGDAETAATTGDTTAVVTPVAPDFETVCTQPTQLDVTIADYYFGGEGAVFNFAAANFNEGISGWSMPNDSTGTLFFRNYTDDQVVDGLKDEHAEIQIAFNTRNGNKLSPGTYIDGTFEPFGAKTTIITNKGTTYFNWVDGMPEVGTVTLNYVDGTHICGEINLSSDDKTLKYIGTVKLSGSFKI